MSPDDGFLQDMLEEARLALTFVSGMSDAEFLSDVKTQHAVVRSLEVIGEAANQVSGATRAQLSSVRGQRSSASAMSRFTTTASCRCHASGERFMEHCRH